MLFDGDLPDSKRAVRLERMESSRQKLEEFRNTNPGLGRYPSDAGHGRAGANAWERRDQSVVKALSLLPHPPFLVSAVIGAVRRQGHTFNIEVVPEEADVACARVAQVSGAAILTNDSDLAVYELGVDGCVLWFRTLETQRLKAPGPVLCPEAEESKTHSRLVCSCVRPAQITRRLGITSFLTYGFQRYLDPSATAITIQLRAQDQARRDRQALLFEDFRKQFEITEYPLESAFVSNFDPRVSEFAIQASRSTEPAQVYLGILHEDPSRESSWVCGSAYRKLAFSLFYMVRHKQSPTHVIEYTRKGSRVAPVSLPLFNSNQILSTAIVMLEKLSIRLGHPDHQTDISLTGAQALRLETVSEWHAAALCTVLQQKIDAGTPPFSYDDADRLFGLEDTQSIGSAPNPGFKPKWDDLHLLANMQAVLYSWRMLKQILDWAYEEADSEGELDIKTSVLPAEVGVLKGWLDSMPIASELFLDLRHMRMGSAEGRERGIAMVGRALERHLGVRRDEMGTRGSEDKGKKKRRRRKVEGKVVAKNHQVKFGGNAFSLLSGDMDE